MGRKDDTVRVFLRIRPHPDASRKYNIDHDFDNSRLKIHVDRRQAGEVVNSSIEDYQFKFERVFDTDTNQEQVFDVVAKNCAMSALDGYNSTVFAYGQTGSGKTYSITGGAESYSDRGIIPRTLSLIYDEIKRRSDYEFTVRISYLQIYNDKGQDLLNRGKDARNLDDLPPVTCHETDDEVVLKGLEARAAKSVEEALGYLFLGDTNRIYCETPMNQSSSRSHCVFTVSLEARQAGSPVVRRSKLNLVDLAGSERVYNTQVSGETLTEAKYINLSLHFLEVVIKALAERRDHIPYRDSFLTKVLRDSLGGNCKSSMLATCHPQDKFMNETISTCRFAQRVACIKQSAKVNEETDPTLLVRRLRQEVAQLKEQLAFYGKGEQSDRELSADEMQRCRDMVNRYIKETDESARMVGLDGDMSRIFCCFKIMKDMIKAGGGGRLSTPQTPVSAAVSGGVGEPNRGSSGLVDQLREKVKSLEVSLMEKENELSLLLHIVDKKRDDNTSMGVSASNPFAGGPGISRGPAAGGTGYHAAVPIIPPQQIPPASQSATMPQFQTTTAGSVPQAQMQQFPEQQEINVRNAAPGMQASSASHKAQIQSAAIEAEQMELSDKYALETLSDPQLLQDRAKAFEAFRRSYRKHEQVEKQKLQMKAEYEMAQQLGRELQQLVSKVKQLKFKIQQIRAENALQNAGTEMTQEEAELRQELEVARSAQTSKAAELAKRKEKIDTMHMMMNKTREQVAKDFETWFMLRQGQVESATGNSGGSEPASVPATEQLFGATGARGLGSFTAKRLQNNLQDEQQYQQQMAQLSNTQLGGYGMTGTSQTTTTPQASVAPSAPAVQSTGNPNADAQLAEMRRVRDEMRRRMSQQGQ